MPLSDYAIGETLGSGAFAQTLAATRKADGMAVAIKRLRLRGLPDWKPFERFEREAKTQRALTHPGVVRFVDAFDETVGGEQQYFLVSERIDGQTLGEAIAAGRRWTEAQARVLLTRVLEILDYLHTLSPRVLHRDLKPSNIMLREDDSPVLIDFGAVADLAAARADGGPTVVGTPGYMPPEQAMGRPDVRSDLYALGATMIHVLSHEHPTALLGDGLRLQIPASVGIDPALAAVLLRLVEPDPDDRYGSARAVLDALDGGAPHDASGERALAVPEPRGVVARIPATPRPLTPAILSTLSMTRATTHRTPLVLTGGLGSMLLMVGVLWLRFPPVFLGFGFVALLAALFGTFVVARNRARGLYEHGRAVAGEVTGAKASEQGQTIVSYRYRSDDGGTHAGQLSTRDALAVQGIERGAAVAVFYDPAQPGVSAALLPGELPPSADPAAGA